MSEYFFALKQFGGGNPIGQIAVTGAIANQFGVSKTIDK